MTFLIKKLNKMTTPIANNPTNLLTNPNTIPQLNKIKKPSAKRILFISTSY